MKKVKDHFYYKAKKENYPARSVYKLEEIDKKYNLIKSGQKILDLGAAPGSWSKYCAEKAGEKGLVIGIDKQDFKIAGFNNIKFIQEDIFKFDIEKIEDICPKFDLVLSDMAPSTTGTKEVDQARSLELAKQALNIARRALKQNGSFVCKIFQGQDVKVFVDSLKPLFEWVKIIKPAGSRSESFETYIVGYKLKGSDSNFL